MQTIKRQNIDYEFYFLDKGFYPKNVALKYTEALLYVNYFGIMNNQVKRLSEKYSNLITDNSKDRMLHLLTRIAKEAESVYAQFKTNDQKLDNETLKNVQVN
ncbi:MAG: hypothetical protein K9G58_13385 [Bacteroidales bacterium]|nr:hypothetical protein [Bacteroidales bacterium]MCF8387421.1 hypothetical protein [Bacteroidales bacterium]MCF8399163.1 hypothetical protein [Bacteroidales bacterium]